MKTNNERIEMERLLTHYPQLACVRTEIEEAGKALIDCFEHGGKVLTCGNGGSASDAEHIVGELMKEFRRRRELPEEIRRKLMETDPSGVLARELRGAFPAVSLVAETALDTALTNDCEPAVVFAQQVLGHGKKGDVLIGMSTSGNARNVNYAFMTARALGIRSVMITGRIGGIGAKNADIVIRIPEDETYRVQELTLPIYHSLCIMVEDHFYPE